MKKHRIIFIVAVFMLPVSVFPQNTLNQPVQEKIDSFTLKREALATQLSQTGRKYYSAGIGAIKTVPRHSFLDSTYSQMAYENMALPGEDGGIIPSPEDILAAISLLAPHSESTVLIAGNNAGYAALVLSKLCKTVYLIEDTSAVQKYTAIFAAEGAKNIITAKTADINAFSQTAAFDRILIHAAVSEISEQVTEQLAIQGNITFSITAKNGIQQLVSLRHSLLGDSIICGGSCFFPEAVHLKIGN